MSANRFLGVGFIVTNMARSAENVVAFYNKRGTCEQWIKEGKGAIKWTRLSCRSFAANAVRLQLHALAYNLGNFLRTLATPEPIKDWSLTSLGEVDQDRGEGHQPRPLCHLPDGRGRQDIACEAAGRGQTYSGRPCRRFGSDSFGLAGKPIWGSASRDRAIRPHAF